MNRPELLAPAGSLIKLKYALTYGADAVYIGGESFSLREAAENFSLEEIEEGISFAHSLNKKVYITANIIPHNKDIPEFIKYLQEISTLNADGIIISDPGFVDLVKKYAPDLEIHISTQANNVNYASANFWYNAGAKRVILARELSLEEIYEIKQNIPEDMDIECFVHGAMCISYSGRCLLSNYMVGRDSNLGACAHPCRWKYYLMEEKRQGEYMPVFENERGTFIYNSKDLCMIRYVPELIKAGVTSFKIEGRVKSEYYVASVVKAYREAIDNALNSISFDEALIDDLAKVSHREYTTGFFFGKPDGNEQIYTSSSYIRNYDLVGVVDSYDEENRMLIVSQRNKFFAGDEIEILKPTGKNEIFTVSEMYDDKNNKINSCPHATMTIKIPFEHSCPKMSFLRKKKD